MGAEIFVEISTGEHQEKTFTSGSRRLAFRAKQQRSPKRFELFRIARRSRWTAPTHSWLWSGPDRKRWHWHTVDLSEGFLIGQDFSHQERSDGEECVCSVSFNNLQRPDTLHALPSRHFHRNYGLPTLIKQVPRGL